MRTEGIGDKLTGPVGLSMIDCETNHIPIDIYVDAVNPARYYVDVTGAPKLDSNGFRQLVSDSRNGLS